MKKSLHRSFIVTAALALSLGLCPRALQAQTVSPSAAPGAINSAPSVSSAPATATQSPVPEEDILDIRGPIHVPAPFPWLTWAAGALGAVALGLCGWAWLRRPRRKLPYQVALEKLEAARPLMQEDNAEPFSLAVSEVVRFFIEESLPVRAAHCTTNEFLHDLVNLPESPLEAHREPLGQFLEHCDLAKFARWSLTVPQMEAMLDSASSFVTAIGKPMPGKNRSEPAVPTTAAMPQPVTPHS